MNFFEMPKLKWYQKLIWKIKHFIWKNPYKRIILPQIRESYPKLLAHEIISVQPMTDVPPEALYTVCNTIDEMKTLRKLKDSFKVHNHDCYCDCGKKTPHIIGEDGCQRVMTEPPDYTKATEFTYREQRGYHQHECGCWSRSPDSTNSSEFD